MSFNPCRQASNYLASGWHNVAKMAINRWKGLLKRNDSSLNKSQLSLLEKLPPELFYQLLGYIKNIQEFRDLLLVSKTVQNTVLTHLNGVDFRSVYSLSSPIALTQSEKVKIAARGVNLLILNNPSLLSINLFKAYAPSLIHLKTLKIKYAQKHLFEKLHLFLTNLKVLRFDVPLELTQLSTLENIKLGKLSIHLTCNSSIEWLANRLTLLTGLEIRMKASTNPKEHSTASIFDCTPLAKMTQLRSLGLDGPSNTLCPPVKNLTNLTKLGYPRLDQEIADDFSGMTQLQSFTLSIKHHMPSLTMLTKLSTLKINYGKLNALGPIELPATLTNLNLDDSINDFHIDWNEVPHLRKLSLSGTLITDNFTSLNQLKHLTILDSEQFFSFIKKRHPSTLPQLSYLNIVDRSGISFTYPLNDLTALTNLQDLNVNTQTSYSYPEMLTNLRSLVLYSDLKIQFPAELPPQTNLIHLELSAGYPEVLSLPEPKKNMFPDFSTLFSLKYLVLDFVDYDLDNLASSAIKLTWLRSLIITELPHRYSEISQIERRKLFEDMKKNKDFFLKWKS